MKFFAGLVLVLLRLVWLLTLPSEFSKTINKTKQRTDESSAYAFDICREERWDINVTGLGNLTAGDTSQITFNIKALCSTPSTRISFHWPDDIIGFVSGDTISSRNFTTSDSITISCNIALPDSGKFYCYLLARTDSARWDTCNFLIKKFYVIIEGDSVRADTTCDDSSLVWDYYEEAEEPDTLLLVSKASALGQIGAYQIIVRYMDESENPPVSRPSPCTRVNIKRINSTWEEDYYTEEDGYLEVFLETGYKYRIKVMKENTVAKSTDDNSMAKITTEVLEYPGLETWVFFCDPPEEAAILEKCYWASEFMSHEMGYTPSGKVNTQWPTTNWLGLVQMSYYNGNEDKICILRNDGFYWTASHEYGHFIADLMYPTESIDTSTLPIYQHLHNYRSKKPPCFALSEGWAEFVAGGALFQCPWMNPYTDYDWIEKYPGMVGSQGLLEDISLPYWRAGEYGENTNPDIPEDKPYSCVHGDSVEGAVAQFLWDLWDSGPEGEYDDEGLSKLGLKITTVMDNDNPYSITQFKTCWKNRGYDDVDELDSVVIHSQGSSSPYPAPPYPLPNPTNFRPSYDFDNDELDLTWTNHAENQGRVAIIYQNPTFDALTQPDFTAGPNATLLNVDCPNINDLRQWRIHAVTADSSPRDTFLFSKHYYYLGFENSYTLPFINSPWSGNPHNVTNVVAQRVTTQKKDGSYSYKFSGTDNSSDNSWAYYNLFNIWSPIFEPDLDGWEGGNFLSAYFKAVASPDGDSLRVSFDGILDPWARLESVWDDDYGWVVDQYGRRMATDYHKIPLGEWKLYIFNLAPAHWNMLKNISVAYTDGCTTPTGNFEAYIDNLKFNYLYPNNNEWFVEVFGGDKNADVTWQEVNDQVDFIVDDNGIGDQTSGELNKYPRIRKNILPIQLNSNNTLSWSQYDKDESLLFEVLVQPPVVFDDGVVPTNAKWLTFAANDPDKWNQQGWVNLGETQTCYNQWESFTRNVVQDYNAEYGTSVTSLEIFAYRVGHYAMKEWDGDHGGSVKDIVIDVQNPGGGQITSIKVLEPHRGIVSAGHNKSIEWTYTPSGKPENTYFVLKYTTNGVNGTWKYVSPCPMAPYDRRKQIWSVPANAENDNYGAYLRVYAYDNKGTPSDYTDDVVLGYGQSAGFSILPVYPADPYGGGQPMSCPPPYAPGGNGNIPWGVVCPEAESPDGLDIDYSVNGGASFTRLVSDIDPDRDGTYGLINTEIVDSDTIVYEGYQGSYTWSPIPNKPTPSLVFRYWLHVDNDSFYGFSEHQYSIANGTGTQFSTAYTSGKQVAGTTKECMVFTNSSGNVIYSESDDGNEWDTSITISPTGSYPSVGGVNDTAIISWVNASSNDQSLYQRNIYTPSFSTLVAPRGTWIQIISEPRIISKNDTAYTGAFVANGSDVGHISSIKLLNFHKTAGCTGSKTDTLYGAAGASLSPIYSAPAMALDDDNNVYCTFVYAGKNIFVYKGGAMVRLDTLSDSALAWPSIDITKGNVYLTYAKRTPTDSIILRKWRCVGDTLWRGTDTIYKGSVKSFSTSSGVYTLLTGIDNRAKLVTFNPLFKTTTTGEISDSIINPHIYLSRLSGKHLAFEWTRQQGSSYYVTSQRAECDALLPVIYVECGTTATPYTTHRDSTHDYGTYKVDWGIDTLVYTLGNLNTSLDYNLALEFFYDDTNATKSFVVSVGADTDTVVVSDSLLTRYMFVIDSPDTSIRVKILGPDATLARLILYEADGSTGGYFSKEHPDEPEDTKPLVFSLSNVMPNPFMRTATISFAVPYELPVTLKVYDVTGREVRTLVNGPVKAGEQSIIWDAKDNQKRAVASGVYFVRMTTKGFKASRKAVLLK